jgi:hypothetical protein
MRSAGTLRAVTPPPPRRPWWSVLTGTRPGLEWFLFGVFPAIAAGAIAAHYTGVLGGIAVGLLTLALGMLLGKRLGRRPPPTGPTS